MKRKISQLQETLEVVKTRLRQFKTQVNGDLQKVLSENMKLRNMIAKKEWLKRPWFLSLLIQFLPLFDHLLLVTLWYV